MELRFSVNMTPGILYDYMVRHTYNSGAGILGTLCGFFMMFIYIRTNSYLYLAAALVLLIYLPMTLWFRSRRQFKMTPAFHKPLDYRVTEEGIYVSRDDTEQLMPWDGFLKAVSTGSSVILYTSRVNAAIFPRKDLGDQTMKVIEAISTHMPPAKVKIRY